MMASIDLTDADDLTRQPSAAGLLRRRVLGHYGFMAGAVILVLFATAAILAPLLTSYDPYAPDLGNRLQPPVFLGGSWEHILGTDFQGRDYLTRIFYGARISLIIGISAAVISGVIGSVLGITAGYFGGRWDMVVTFLVNVRLSMPVILVALAVVAILGSSLETVIVVLGLLLWDRFAVVMRSSTIQVRGLDYIAAAEALGCSVRWILVREILPNIANNLIVVATLEMAHAILLEAALSFLGLGVQPPEPSLGLMVAEGKDMLFFQPWVIVVPGVAVMLLVLAINLMGDGARDLSAPENRS